MKVRIDPDLCIGDGSCAEICPAVFEMRGDGLAYVKAKPDYEACGETLDQAIEGCPVEAIIVDEP
jgi:ferredoxin